MKTINLRVLYPDAYKSDYYVEVPDEVAEVFETFERMEKAYMQRVYYHMHIIRLTAQTRSSIASCSRCFRRKKSMSEN